MKNLPYMPFWVRDFFAECIMWEPEDVGAYILCLCKIWDKGAQSMSVLERVPGFEKLMERHGDCFVLTEDGRVTNVRLEEIREESIQKVNMRKERAKAAAKARWGATSNAQAMHKHSSSISSSNAQADAKAVRKQETESKKGEENGAEKTLSPETRQVGDATSNAQAMLKQCNRAYSFYITLYEINKSLDISSSSLSKEEYSSLITTSSLKKLKSLKNKIEKMICEEVIAFFNHHTGRNFRPLTYDKQILARLYESSVQELIDVIVYRCALWLDDDEMDKHLTPETIFRKSKYEKYREYASTQRARGNSPREVYRSRKSSDKGATDSLFGELSKAR